MAIQKELVILNGDKSIRLYLNDKDEIFVEEVCDDPLYGAWFTINRDDWDEIKAFIDEQFDTL